MIRSTLTLTIVGAGNDEEFLHSLSVELGIAQRVQFLGWVEHNQLGELYDEAMMVVVPSRWPEAVWYGWPGSPVATTSCNSFRGWGNP